MPAYDDSIQLIESLEDAAPNKGIRFVNKHLEESSHSYPDLLRRVRRFARQFHTHGVRQGQKVLVALSTEVDSVCSFLALIYLGAVPFSVASPLVSQDRKAHRRRLLCLVTQHGVDRILASEHLRGIAGASAGIPLEKQLVPPDPNARGTATGPAVTPADVAPDDVAFVQFSSGSTRDPRGVRITHRNLLCNMSSIVQNDHRTEESVGVCWLPLYHDMGLVGCLLSNLIFKNDLVLMDPLCFLTRPVSWLAAISKVSGTVAAIPNFALDICTNLVTDEQLREHAVDLSSFRYVYNGSEPVRLKSIRRFERRFEKYGFVPGSIYPVYGMSEATLMITAPKHGESVVVGRNGGMELPSVGYPLGDFQVRIRDEEGKALAPGQVGEILARGTSIAPGFLRPSVGSTGFTSDGWLATGDLGFLDGAGRLYVTGRKKDLIICQGRNFYGHDVAAGIEELPHVRKGKVCVFTVDTDQQEKAVIMMGQPRIRLNTMGFPKKRGVWAALMRPVQVLLRWISSRITPVDLDDFKATVRKFVLREFGLPVHDVHLVRQFPLTTSGKVARQRCEQLYRDFRKAAAARDT